MTKIFGIVNLSPDSFSNDYSSDLNIIKKRILLAKNKGFYGIDIGAKSTRPNATNIDHLTERKRLELLSFIVDYAKMLNLRTSIDSYSFDNIEHAIANGIDYVNDVSGGNNINIINLIKKHKHINYIIMHSLSLPANPNIVFNDNVDVVDELLKWIRDKLLLLKEHNIEDDRIIFDPGIGFGKSSKQSMDIIDNIEKIKKYCNCKTYIGHSRKSFLRLYIKNYDLNSNLDEIDMVTNDIASTLIAKEVDYLRLHIF